MSLVEQLNRYAPLGVLLGGTTGEREISLESGGRVCEALCAAGVDARALDIGANPLEDLRTSGIGAAVIMLHGGGGEGGRLQVLLQSLDIPYTGSDFAACALAMDKHRAKSVWRGQGLLTPDWQLLYTHTDWSAVLAQLGLPLFVKPVAEGSSLGISKLDASADAADLELAWVNAGGERADVMAECGADGGEFTVGILNGTALPPIRIRPARAFYDYEAKYQASGTVYECPVQLEMPLIADIQQLALAAFAAVGGSGWGRVDIVLSEAGFALIDINLVPGMAARSLIPQACTAAGMDYQQTALAIAGTLLPESRG